MKQKKFWENKELSELSEDEWEQICCHCGRCCLIKLQDDETNDIYYTNIICHLFDTEKHLCTKYADRCLLVPECVKITPKNIQNITWMPKKCAYRILLETKDLPSWHPLKENTPKPSLPNNLIKNNLVDEKYLEDYIIEDEEF